MTQQTIFEYVKSLQLKKYHFDGEHSPYLINCILSQNPYNIQYVNVMNYYNGLTSEMQYDFYYYSLKEPPKYFPYKKKTIINNLELIQEYYDYSEEKAKQVINLISNEQLKIIKDSLKKNE